MVKDDVDPGMPVVGELFVNVTVLSGYWVVVCHVANVVGVTADAFPTVMHRPAKTIANMLSA